MNDILAINMANTELREGYNRGDVERVMALFAPGFTDFTVGQPSFYGSEAREVLQARLRRLFRDYKANLVITIIDVMVRGENAIDYGWRELTLTPKSGGEPVTSRARYVTIWQKMGDGNWRIVISIDNADLPPQMPDLEDDDSANILARSQH